MGRTTPRERKSPSRSTTREAGIRKRRRPPHADPWRLRVRSDAKLSARPLWVWGLTVNCCSNGVWSKGLRLQVDWRQSARARARTHQVEAGGDGRCEWRLFGGDICTWHVVEDAISLEGRRAEPFPCGASVKVPAAEDDQACKDPQAPDSA